MPRAVCLDFEYGQGRVSPDLPNITETQATEAP